MIRSTKLEQQSLINVGKVIVTMAKECMCSANTSFSGSVSMALSSSGQMKLHIPCRYCGPTHTIEN
jgi:hypothetical protein